MQSKLESLVESLVGISIGFTIAVLTGVFIYPLFHYQVPLKENCEITFFFTIVSIIRQYYVRRLFNWRKFGKARGQDHPPRVNASSNSLLGGACSGDLNRVSER